MITSEQINKALERNDAVIEEHGSSIEFFQTVGVDALGVINAARDRAVRAVLYMRPDLGSKFVDFSEDEQKQLNFFMALFLDGFAARCSIENI